MIVIESKTGIPTSLIVDWGIFQYCKMLFNNFSHAFEIYKYILTQLTLWFMELYSSLYNMQTLSIHTSSETNDRPHFFYLIKEMRPAVGFQQWYSQTSDLKFNSNIGPVYNTWFEAVYSDNHEFYHRSSVKNISDHIFSQTLNPHPFGGGGG